MTEHEAGQFTTLVYFLGNVLGPDYEITLYDLEADEPSVIAIANGRLSGQTVGSPLPETARELLSGAGSRGDCIENFTSHLKSTGKAVRSSAMLIRDGGGRPVGLLGINFDDSRFLSVSRELLQLIHPGDFVLQQYPGQGDKAPGRAAQPQAGEREALHNDVSGMIEEIFAEASQAMPIPLDRLTQDERVAFIAQLRKRGIFRLKGSVQYAAERLGCSQASIYRYLGKARAESDGEE